MNMPELAPASHTHDAISKRAAAFFERRRFGEWSEADKAEFDAWLAESPLHRAAYLRVEGIVAHTRNLVALSPEAFGKAARRSARRFPFRPFVLPLLIAASIVLLVAAAFPLADYLLQPPVRTYSTDVGGRTLLSFADHTQIELNTDTIVRFRMSNRERIVWLDRGEAWFHVAHNPADPFTLIVGKDRVTDLGTEFLVRKGADRTEVALLEGRAALSTQGAPTATLIAGEDAIATPVSISVTKKTPRELADALAWRRGMLVFRKTRLADVVREFNRYNATKLVLADPSIANVEITADLKTDDYEDFLNLAQTVLNLRADRDGNDILISRAQAGAKGTRAMGAR